MALARVSSIAGVVSLQAKSVDGVWRDLTEGSAVEDREEILCEADGAQYGLSAYKLQRRSGAAWVDAETVTLNVADGCSNYRQDRIAVDGDDTDSSAELLLTVEQGQVMLAQLLTTLKGQERARFTLRDGATRYRGIVDDVAHGNKGELGGFEQDFKGSVLCNREQFSGAAAPTRGDKITLLTTGLSYRIDSVKVDEISYLIELVSINR